MARTKITKTDLLLRLKREAAKRDGLQKKVDKLWAVIGRDLPFVDGMLDDTRRRVIALEGKISTASRYDTMAHNSVIDRLNMLERQVGGLEVVAEVLVTGNVMSDKPIDYDDWVQNLIAEAQKTPASTEDEDKPPAGWASEIYRRAEEAAIEKLLEHAPSETPSVLFLQTIKAASDVWAEVQYRDAMNEKRMRESAEAIIKEIVSYDHVSLSPPVEDSINEWLREFGS